MSLCVNTTRPVEVQQPLAVEGAGLLQEAVHPVAVEIFPLPVRREPARTRIPRISLRSLPNGSESDSSISAITSAQSDVDHDDEEATPTR